MPTDCCSLTSPCTRSAGQLVLKERAQAMGLNTTLALAFLAMLALVVEIFRANRKNW